MLAWLLFFVVFLGLSASLVMVLSATKGSESRRLGETQSLMLERVLEGEKRLVFVDEAVRVGVERALVEWSVHGGLSARCEQFEGYTVVGSEGCAWEEDGVGSFFGYFKEVYDAYLKQVGGGVTAFGYVLGFREENGSVYFVGRTSEFFDFSQGVVSYKVFPDFKQRMLLNLSVVGGLIREVEGKRQCVVLSMYDQTRDDDQKIVKGCGFSSAYKWKVRKKGGFALVEALIVSNTRFVGDVWFKFAISLNSGGREAVGL